MKIMLSSPSCQPRRKTFLNLYYTLLVNKIRCFGECSHSFFPHNESGWGLELSSSKKKLNFFTIVQIIWSHTTDLYASSHISYSIYCYYDIKLLVSVFLILVLKLTSELKAAVLCHCRCECICVCVCINVMSHRAVYICLLWGSHFPFLCPFSSSWPCQPIKKQHSSAEAVIAGDLTWDFQHSSYSLSLTPP